MADESELQHIRRPTFSTGPAKVKSGLISRGRGDVSALREPEFEKIHMASVGLENGGGHFNRRFGLINRDGAFVIEPKHSAPLKFACGLARFSTAAPEKSFRKFTRVGRQMRPSLFDAPRGRFGFIGLDGGVRVSPAFPSARAFSEGLAGVEVDGKWGFIDKSGDLVVKPKFAGVRDFKNGLAVAKQGEKCGFIDKAGEFVIEPIFDYLLEFSEGFACAEFGGSYGYLAPDGSFAIGPKFESASDFLSGIAEVKSGSFHGLIDVNGKALYECTDDSTNIARCANGFALIWKSGAGYLRGNYVDAFGQLVLTDESLNASACFSEGLGAVWKEIEGRPRFGYVDELGQLKIALAFSHCAPFKQGLARISPVGSRLYGFIDHHHNEVIEARFVHVESFSGGMAKCRNDNAEARAGIGIGKWGYIDLKGNLSISHRFDQAGDFEEMAI